MATYEEVADILSGVTATAALDKKVKAAIAIKAADTLNGSPFTAEARWARQAMEDPDSEFSKVKPLVIGLNDDQTVANIQGASDAAVKANVDSVVDSMVREGAF